MFDSIDSHVPRIDETALGMDSAVKDDLDDLTRQTSRQTFLSDDAVSFTQFPTPIPRTRAQSNGSSQPLNELLGDGPSMFDESNAIDASNPQALSAASVPVLQNIIDYHGAVELVQRLSAALAERDAHITALTRLAEEYRVPRGRIVDAASRVKQAERRRLSLAAASEDLITISAVGSDSGESRSIERTSEPTAAAKGITRLFGGVGKRRESLKPTPSSSRSTSRPAGVPERTRERPQSIDVPSNYSAHSVSGADNGWTSALFGPSFPRRHDSISTRLPVEMTTRHDKDQLPPTLSNQTDDPQEAEWNSFLVKLVEQRQQNGEDIGDGEMIGASHFGRDGNEGRKKMDQLSRLVIGGIPMKLRHAIWMELSNTSSIMKPNAYAYYVGLKQEDEHSELEAILKDVPRTLTSKYDFYSGKGFKKLKEVLFAFVGRYPDLGYTQGLNTIAGYLLLAIPSEEDAFWMLCNIVENYYPDGYFSRSDAMDSPLADNVLLREYIKDTMPHLHEHMVKLKILPEHTAPIKWFFTAFSSALPETITMRLWDVWLCLPKQKNFLFAFALALLSQNADGIRACEDAGSHFSFLDSKLSLPETPEQATELIKLAYKIGKKLGNIGEKRAEAKERMGLENRLKLRKTQSLEVLVDREDQTTTESSR